MHAIKSTAMTELMFVENNECPAIAVECATNTPRKGLATTQSMQINRE